MAKKTNPKLIGGFVVGAIALLVAGVIAFGGGKFFTQQREAVVFFSGASLSGLDVGSPVTFRGVKIGAVTRVVLQYDIANQHLHVPVFITIEPDKFQITSGTRDEERNLPLLVERGLRAQLVVQSLVTGQASVDFDFHPGTPVNLVGTEKGVRELPTVPSDIDMLKANVSEVLKKISALPLNQIADHSLEAVKSANQLLTNFNRQATQIAGDVNTVSQEATLMLRDVRSRLALQAGEPMQNLNEALVDARRLINNVDKSVAPVAKGVDQMIKASLGALDEAQRTFVAAQGTVSPDSTLYFQLVQTLRSVQGASGSIRAFADYLQRHPDALLVGKR
jgi:paraquat-inducible protein B